MPAESRIVLLGRDGRSSRILFNALRAEFGPPLGMIEPPIERVQMLRRRVERYGFGTVVGQALFRLFVVPRLTASSRGRAAEIMAANRLDDSPIPEGARVLVPSANSDQAIELLRSHSPSVVVVSGARILSREVLRCTPAPFLNIHAGITPLYRGVHGAYWALVEKDPEHCGVTLHRVDEGIDTGPILAQATIRPTSGDNFATYPLLQLATAVPMMLGAVGAILQGREPAVIAAPSGQSTYRTHPTLLSYLRAGVP